MVVVFVFVSVKIVFFVTPPLLLVVCTVPLCGIDVVCREVQRFKFFFIYLDWMCICADWMLWRQAFVH